MTGKMAFLGILFFIGCLQVSQKGFDDFIVTPFYANTLNGNSSNIALEFEFRLDKDVNFIFDYDALSLDSFNAEDVEIKSSDDLLKIVERIEYSQFIVENESKERRFFSDIMFFDGEEFESKDVLQLDRAIDTVRLKGNKITRLRSVFIDVNRFKIHKNDTTIRLYYIYKPTNEERRMGLKEIQFKSNWISLYPK